MVRILLYSLVLALSPRALSPAHDTTPPGQLVLDGGGALPLAGYASRTCLLDTAVYTIAVYVSGSLDREHLAAADVPKVLRIAVTYVDDLQRRHPCDWRSELVPSVEPAASAHLRGVLAPIQNGDIVQIEYTPGRGTTVRVNRAVAASRADHDLMLAFLDHWLGQRPVSEELKRTLLAAH
jgi:chalcone isomerase-like protein